MRRGTPDDFISNSWELDFCKLCKKETFIVDDLTIDLVPYGFTIFCGKKCFWVTTSETSANLYCKDFGIKFFPNSNRDKLYTLSNAISPSLEFIKPKTKEGFSFRKWQEALVEYCQLAGNVLVADEMRLGKSYGALGSCLYDEKVLIVVPFHLKETWREFIEIIHPNPNISLLKPRDYIRDGFNIINYDILHTLLMSQVNTAIVDEAHMIKEFDARRTKAVHSIIANKKLALTGTPVLNRTSELLSILQWLDSKWEKVRVNGNYITDGSFHLDKNQFEIELRSTCLIKRTKALVSDSLPIKENVIKVDCPDYLRGYDISLADTARRKLQIGLYKVPCVIDYCNIYTEKIVVFTYHEEVILRLKASLGNICGIIYGKTSKDERRNIIDSFKSGRIRILLISIPVGSVGIDLSVADRILFAEQDWNLLMEQAKERCSNMVKSYHVNVETMIVESSLDEKMFNDLKRKDKEQL